MVKTTIGGIEVQDFIMDGGYTISIEPVYGDNSFKDVNSGAEVLDKLGDKITLNLSLEGVPHSIAAQLAEILTADSVEVEYTTPAPAVSNFKKTGYRADCSDSDPDETDPDVTDGVEWDIDVTLESVEYADNGDRL
ncbi:MAG: hypothetical protein ACI4J6_12635 [Oscillospiraceae bacterium]